MAGAAQQIPTRTVAVALSADAHLENGKPNENFGRLPQLSLQSGSRSRLLLAVDSVAIVEALQGQALLGAQLELFTEESSKNWGPDGQDLGVFRLSQPWQEEAVTWTCPADEDLTNHRPDCPEPWDGGTCLVSPTSTHRHTREYQGWISFDVTADLQAFLDGTELYGWLLKQPAPPYNGTARFTSREGDPSHAPRLVLTLPADVTPPGIVFTAPAAAVIYNDFQPLIALTLTDDLAGLTLATLEVSLDGASLLPLCQVDSVDPLAAAVECSGAQVAVGSHEVVVRVRDGAGNLGSAVFVFEAVEDRRAPFLVIFTPRHRSAVALSPLAVRGEVTDDQVVARLEIQGSEAAVVNGRFAAEVELQEGENTVRLVAWDGAGNEASSSLEVTLDLHPPELILLSPTAQELPGRDTLDLRFSYRDSESYVDTSSLEVILDGAEVTESCLAAAFEVSCLDLQLVGIDHLVTARLADGAGNVGILHVPFTTPVDTEPPVLVMLAPPPGSVLSSPAVQVAGQVSDAGEVVQVLVDGAEVRPDSQGFFARDVPLPTGDHSILVEARDVAGNVGRAEIAVTVDALAPRFKNLKPVSGAWTTEPSLRVAGAVEEDGLLARVEIAGQEVAVDARRAFEVPVSLAVGANVLSLRAVDGAGNEGQETLLIERIPFPRIEMLQPLPGTVTGQGQVDVHGTVDPSVVRVTVNGQPAELAGGLFHLPALPLGSGATDVVAIAEDGLGHRSSVAVTVLRDRTPPVLAVEYPLAGDTVFAAEIPVYGLVNDLVAGTVNGEQVRVTVNGRPAEVADRRFFLPSLSLPLGLSTVEVEATDRAGNTGRQSLPIERTVAAGPVLEIVAGNLQQGVIGTALPETLEVAARDGGGLAVVGVPVVFRVLRNDGSLAGGSRSAVVRTDATGLARVTYTLGTRAQAGRAVVEAAATGFGRPLRFVATAQAGELRHLIVDSGNGQTGIAGRSLPEPFAVVVTDEGYNRLPGIPVTFEVVRGDGSFRGAKSLEVMTNSDGEAEAFLILDSQEGQGLNEVKALVDFPAGRGGTTFVASGMAADPRRPTSVSGRVLDNTDRPVPGVTLRVRGTPLATTAAVDGSFEIAGVPVEVFYLEVDGSTAQRSGHWPHLEFKLYPVPGRQNPMPRPIYLLPLAEEGVEVSSSQGGVLTLAEVPGFALEIEPGSVTFPDGSSTGTVSVTAVHVDKVPMTPNFGQQPRFIVTIQPAGAVFDPPARLTLPNSDGLPPGRSVDLYSFDHDLGRFVGLGPATVSNDGRVIEADPGVGVVKAGWHCGGQPSVAAITYNCEGCKTCGPEGVCEFRPIGTLCNDKDRCTVDDQCFLGECFGEDVFASPIEGPCALAYGETGTYSVETNGADELKWKASSVEGASREGRGSSFTVTFPAISRELYRVDLQVSCDRALQAKKVAVAAACSSLPNLDLRSRALPGRIARENWGQFEASVFPSKIVACVSGNKNCAKTVEMTYVHRIAWTEPDSEGRVRIRGGEEKIPDILSANDSRVGPETCFEIITDVYPLSCLRQYVADEEKSEYGDVRGPYFEDYFNSEAGRVHEEAHQEHFDREVLPSMLLAAHGENSMLPCSCGEEESPRDRMWSDLETALHEVNKRHKEGSEKRAYLVENEILKALVFDIQERAMAAPSSEGWPDFCLNAVERLEALIESEGPCP